MALVLAAVAVTGTMMGTQSVSARHHGHHGVAPSQASATAVVAHSPAYLYGFGLGKNAGLQGYYDVMNDCSNRPYLSTNGTGAIKNFTSLQQVNDCDSGYDHGWNKYCHIGLARHPDPAAACPGISSPKTDTKSSQY